MRRTKKYVAALKVARSHKVTQAQAHEVLYSRLDDKGWAWDPDMGRDGGWYQRAEVAEVAAPRPVERPRASVFADMPLAQAANERVRVERLEAELGRAFECIASLERQLLLLQSLDVVRGSLGRVFDLELAGCVNG